MADADPLPKFAFRDDGPTLFEMAARGVRDLASVIPAAVLRERSVQLPSPPFGPRSPLVIADPDLARLVLVDKAGGFGRDRLLKRLMRRSWGDGLAGAEGAAWKQQREAAAPAFRAAEVSSRIPDFAAAAREVADTLRPDSPVDLTELAGRIVARIVLRVLVAAEGLAEPDAVAAIMPAYVDAIAAFGLADVLPLPERWHDRLRGIDRNAAVKRVKATARKIARERGTGDERSDLIDLLARAGPMEDNIRGLFPAAMDTTVRAAAWTLFILSRRTEWQDRIAAEAQACAGRYELARLPLARRAVQEALRLFPPAPMLVRSALRDTEVDGKPVRAGQTVAVSIYAMHRHRSLWDDPDGFDPDRFAPEHGQHKAYLPFGLGPRSCVAAQFALAEITVVVACLLATVALSRSDGLPSVSLRVSTRPTGPLTAYATKRRTG